MDDLLHTVLRHSLNLPFDAKISDSDKVIDDLGADSLNVVEIVMEIENEFNIEIDDTEIEKIITVGDIKKLIKDLA